MTQTVENIKNDIIEVRDQGERILTENERNNRFLDGIIEVTGIINEVNKVYLGLFPLLDKLSRAEFTCKDQDDVKEIIDIIQLYRTKTSEFFANVSRVSVLQSGCKSALDDLRSNIRTLREYLEDIEESFFLEDNEDINALVDGLI